MEQKASAEKAIRVLLWETRRGFPIGALLNAHTWIFGQFPAHSPYSAAYASKLEEDEIEHPPERVLGSARKYTEYDEDPAAES